MYHAIWSITMPWIYHLSPILRYGGMPHFHTLKKPSPAGGVRRDRGEHRGHSAMAAAWLLLIEKMWCDMIQPVKQSISPAKTLTSTSFLWFTSRWYLVTVSHMVIWKPTIETIVCVCVCVPHTHGIHFWQEKNWRSDGGSNWFHTCSYPFRCWFTMIFNHIFLCRFFFVCVWNITTPVLAPTVVTLPDWNQEMAVSNESHPTKHPKTWSTIPWISLFLAMKLLVKKWWVSVFTLPPLAAAGLAELETWFGSPRSARQLRGKPYFPVFFHAETVCSTWFQHALDLKKRVEGRIRVLDAEKSSFLDATILHPSMFQAFWWLNPLYFSG